MVQVAPGFPDSTSNSRRGPAVAWSSGRVTINATAPWLITAGGYPGHGLLAPYNSSTITHTVPLLCLGVDFKDLQSHHFRFRSLGSFLKNTSLELCRYPFASTTDGPHPILLPINDRRTNTHSLPHCAMERVYTHRRNDTYIGFHTRITPCLPPDVKVLFQTGNTLGFVSLNRTRNTNSPFSD